MRQLQFKLGSSSSVRQGIWQQANLGRLLSLTVISLVLVGCNNQPSANQGGGTTNTPAANGAKAVRGKAVVTTLPLRQFAQAIAGDVVDVVLPIPAEEDPAFWQPAATDVTAMQSADLIFVNGATFESWLPTVTLPETRVVDTSLGFKDKLINMAEGLTHSHGPAGEHTHTGIVGTTWIDLDQARQQATAILAAMSKKWPEHKATFETNFAKLETQLKKLDDELQQVAGKMRELPLVVSHPIYDYWLRRYQLNGKSVHWEASEVPTPENIEELKKLLVDHPAKYMIWEGDPAAEAVQVLKEMGLESVVFTPAGNGTVDDNWLSLMQENIERLKSVFK